jgi:hypothetical protein
MRIDDTANQRESFLRDFPVGEFPYLMEHVRQHVADRPQGKATTSSGST